MRKKSTAFIIFIIIVGALIGTAIGEVIGILVPQGVVQDFFLKSASASIGPGTLDIILLTITLGFSFKLNVMGVIGILIAAYALRWID
ncbi:MAG: DUF4321 domain-containing protein [Calditrichia bacterium]|jgi:uncharacterized membrane protein|nr:DUF4321 domain-containing protein [Calditrichia bacterium]